MNATILSSGAELSRCFKPHGEIHVNKTMKVKGLKGMKFWVFREFSCSEKDANVTVAIEGWKERPEMTWDEKQVGIYWQMAGYIFILSY